LISFALISGLTLATTPAVATPKAPTIAEIEAAKKAEAYLEFLHQLSYEKHYNVIHC